MTRLIPCCLLLVACGAPPPTRPDGTIPVAPDPFAGLSPLPHPARGAAQCDRPRALAASTRVPDEVRVVHALPRPDARDISPDTTFALLFNTAVQARDVLARARLVGPDLVPLALGRVTDRQRLVRDNPLVAIWPATRLVVLRATRTLKRSGRYALTIGAGVAGPTAVRPTTRPIRLRFRTWAPLRVVSASCLGPTPCRARSPLRLTFNNPLADPDPGRHLKVHPPPPGLAFWRVGRHILIFGRFQAASRVGLRVRPTLRDVFGQTARRYEVVVPLAGEPPEVRFVAPPWSTLNPHRAARVVVDVSGVHELRLRMLRVTRQNLTQVLSLLHAPRGSAAPDPLEGVDRVLVDRVIRLRPPHGLVRRRSIDPWRALRGLRVGVLYVNLQDPALAGPLRQQPSFRHRIVQLTRIVLQLHEHRPQVEIHAVDRRSGRPLSSLDLEVITATGFSRWLGKTDAQGRVRIPRARLQGGRSLYLVATRGRDLALLPLSGQPARDGAVPREHAVPDLRAFVTSLFASALPIIAASVSETGHIPVAPARARTVLSLPPGAAPARVVCGDQFELRAVVANPSNRHQRFFVKLRSAGAAVVGSPTRALGVPPGRHTAVHFQLQARRPGSTRIQVGARSRAVAHGVERRVRVTTAGPAAPVAGQGLVVLRRLLTHPGGRSLPVGPDRVIRVRLGSRVRIWLALIARKAVDHVVLFDRLPAGLQAESFHSTGSAFSFRRLGPSGIGLAARRLRPGVHVVTYIARARYGGIYHAPATRAVSLTQPGAQGHSSPLRVRVARF